MTHKPQAFLFFTVAILVHEPHGTNKLPKHLSSLLGSAFSLCRCFLFPPDAVQSVGDTLASDSCTAARQLPSLGFFLGHVYS